MEKWSNLRTAALLFAVVGLSACGGGSSTSAPPANDAPGSDDSTDDGNTDSNSDDLVGGAGSTTIRPNRVLAELPSPPLTGAPGEDSEPVRATGPVSTVREFFLVRNPAGDLIDTFGIITDEEFATGPLPPVFYTPDHIDTSTNSPPYFENLNDVEVLAGQTMTLVLKPLDLDGGIPGLFPQEIPSGAQYVDNLDGTRSLIWNPLEPDVGIREFTITATDPIEPFYRTERTVRIKVSMPSDPSTITNLPPVVNLIRPATVRVNDPVVLYIKADDQNGSIPTLEINNPPTGSTITPHFDDPKVTILRFTPRVAENINLELIAYDQFDRSLTGRNTVSIEVLGQSAFDRPGARLRELAAARDLLFGYAALLKFYEQPDGAVYADIAAEEFNLVTTENSLKWDRLNPLPGKYRWAEADNLVAHAKARRQAVHGHTLVWHRQLPAWIQRTEPAEREIHMREFIDRVLTRYGNDIPIWDVVNEALEEDGSFRSSIWFEAMGAEFIDTAFRQARASAPNATLLYNDYDVSFAGPKADGLMALMQSLKDANTPVDGVGFQMHLDSDFDRYDEVAANFQTIADMDLDIYITELDVSIRDGQTEEQQATVYAEVLSLCLEQPRCKAFQIWGFTDMYSWRSEYRPLIMDDRYQIKPAYEALQRRLSEN
ncbi:MAG: endo-1,4-beta-xylanase [Granulosicoccus sp.]